MAKNHGTGGHGRHGRELRRKFEHEIKIKEKLARAVASKDRWLERKSSAAIAYINTELVPVATAAANRITQAHISPQHKKPIARHQALIRLLAVDAWQFEEAQKKVRELGIAHLVDLEDLHNLKKEERQGIWEKLIGRHEVNGKVLIGRTSKQLTEEINLWKKRVPQMSKGQYL
jgi:hypothetical protein